LFFKFFVWLKIQNNVPTKCSPDGALVHLHFDGNGAHGLLESPFTMLRTSSAMAAVMQSLLLLCFFLLMLKLSGDPPAARKASKLLFH
jgi:hypothetical protein